MFDSIKGWLWAHGKMLIGIFISTMLIKSGGIVGKIFGTLGLAYVTYTYVMPEVKSYLLGALSYVNPDVVNLIGYVQLDKAMVMILSAGATKLASNVFLGKAAA